MNAYIGRQAIYNQDMVIAGYELLYRNGMAKRAAVITDEDAATRGVLSDAVTVFGIANLTNNLPAYINFTRKLIMDDFAYLVDPCMIVIEVPASVSMDDALETKLSELHRVGYQLALDGYSEVNGLLRFDRMIELFDVIRVNVGGANRLKMVDLARRLRRSRAKILAERIENEQDYDNAMTLGAKLFQGYFFEKPTCLSKEIPPLAASSYGRLLNELLGENVNFDRCADIVQNDVMLTYLLLRQVQTLNYYRGTTISDIRHTMVMMGTEGLRRWVSLVLLKQNNVSHSDVLSRRAYLRGRFIERLMENADTELQPRQGFLMGMFSLLDRVMGIQLQTLLKDLNLEPALKDALLGKAENEYSMFLQYAVIYEMANERLILPDIGLRINEIQVSHLYMQCIADTDAAFEGVVAPTGVYRGNLLR